MLNLISISGATLIGFFVGLVIMVLIKKSVNSKDDQRWEITLLHQHTVEERLSRYIDHAERSANALESIAQYRDQQLKMAKFTRCSERLPELGQKVIIYSAGVIQEEIYELDQADDGFGGGEYFWSRDGLDEFPPVDFEDDQWIYPFYLIALLEKGEV